MTTTTRPPSYQPRLLEHVQTQGRTGRTLRLPDQWLRGLLAGAEALILGWLVLVVPAVATYVATAAAPALGSAGWVEAAQIATAGWFLAHGAPIAAGDGVISTVPLGLTILYSVLMATAIRRARLVTWTPVLVAIGTYVALGAMLLLLSAPQGAPWGLVGAGLVAGLGATWGMRGHHPDLPEWIGRGQLPAWVQFGVRGIWRVVATLLVLAMVILVAAIALGIDRILDIHRSLHADVVSTVVIVLAMLLVLPVLLVWSMAFLLGPGFAVGTQTLFSPGGVEAGPLPLIPVLGALPEPDSLAANVPFVIVMGIAVGVLAGWWLVRRQRDVPLWQPVASLVVTVAGSAVLVAALGWLASGGIGPGAMAQVGPDPIALAWAATWQLGAGGLLPVIALHPGTRRAVAGGITWVRAQVDARSARAAATAQGAGGPVVGSGPGKRRD